jgi:hypothetical protein
MEKINRMARNNLFFILYLHDELQNFLRRMVKYILKLTDRYPGVKKKANNREVPLSL